MIRQAQALLSIYIVLVLVLVLAPSTAAARDTPALRASRHFQRGVTLFNDGDYRGSLVEFKRANEIKPNPAVLYNIGQVHYQLQNYGAALTALESFLARASPGDPNRSSAQSTLELVRARVGKLQVQCNEEGAEILVDDESAGRTPLVGPLVVGMGRRRVVAQVQGKEPQTRYVEVAAGESASVSFSFAEAARPTITASAAIVDPAVARSRWRTTMITGWCATGALLLGAAITGGLALSANNDTSSALGKYPLASRADLDNPSSRAKSLAIATDVLGGLAIVSAGVSLYFTLRPPKEAQREKEKEKAAPTEAKVRFNLTPGGVLLRGTF